MVQREPVTQGIGDRTIAHVVSGASEAGAADHPPPDSRGQHLNQQGACGRPADRTAGIRNQVPGFGKWPWPRAPGNGASAHRHRPHVRPTPVSTIKRLPCLWAPEGPTRRFWMRPPLWSTRRDLCIPLDFRRKSEGSRSRMLAAGAAHARDTSIGHVACFASHWGVLAIATPILKTP